MTTPTYLVFGSTGGIGRVLCERLAKRGASLVLGGRDPGKLSELAARTAGEVCPADRRLVATNWIRTSARSLRGLLVLPMVSSAWTGAST